MILRPYLLDGFRNQNSIILAKRVFFVEGSTIDVTEHVIRLAGGMCVCSVCVCSVCVYACDATSYPSCRRFPCPSLPPPSHSRTHTTQPASDTRTHTCTHTHTQEAASDTHTHTHTHTNTHTHTHTQGAASDRERDTHTLYTTGGKWIAAGDLCAMTMQGLDGKRFDLCLPLCL